MVNDLEARLKEAHKIEKALRKEHLEALEVVRELDREFKEKIGTTTKEGLNTKVKVTKNNETLIFTNTNTGRTLITTRWGNTYNERKVYELINGKRVKIADGCRSVADIKKEVMG